MLLASPLNVSALSEPIAPSIEVSVSVSPPRLAVAGLVDRSTTTAVVPAKVAMSTPLPPLSLSLPGPPSSTSLPSLPLSVSLPPRPLR